MGKETEEIILAGFGGQGILFLGKVLAEVGMAVGKKVSWIPSYGPEMRGGTANCSVVISQNEIASPIVLEPDALIAMNKPSVTKFEPKVKEGGTMIVNSSLIDITEFRKDIKTYSVPASEMANEIGNDKVANVIMAGVYSKLSGLFTYDEVVNAFPNFLPASKKELLEININAFKKGFEFAESLN
ncbi:MAG: 2-oxoacid:acceptor oxidoreductase family protein [Candidatus Rifleibacteriota bacterium]